MEFKPTRPPNHPIKSKGFALVVTLSLMVLLTIIAIGLLTLSSISLRSSTQADLMQQARQNARMALCLAIGQLQSNTGPDQRITAPARIRGDDVSQSHLTGVWQGWKWDGVGTADYKDKKDNKFLQWLTSTRDPNAVVALDYVKSSPGGATAKLVPENTVSPEIDQVEAEVVSVTNTNNSLTQGVAWAVFDESTKLPTALPEPVAASLTSNMHRMSAAPLPGYASTTLRNWDTIGLLADNRKKLVTPGQSGLTGMTAEDRSFHDLTSRTAGVISDTGNGGLAKDLSRLFSGSTSLPPAYANRFLYSDTNTPLVPSPTRFSGANPFPSPDPSWNLLYSHYRMFDQMGTSMPPTVSTSTIARPAAGSTGSAVSNSPFFNNQQIVPSIAKAQFVFSTSFGWHSAITSCSKTGNAALPDSDPNKDLYVTWLVIDPVITLWNPYNVNLRFTGGRIDLYRVPLMFRYYKNGQLINTEYTHLANCFLSTDFANRANTYFRLNLLPPRGSSELVMAPGEHIVFSAVNHVKTYLNQFSDEGVNLRPGFSPPAGNASGSDVGGVSTLNVCVASNGSNSGTDYSRSVRSIAVKPGDVIKLDVKQGRAAVDKPKETGGKEVTGFLKYYVGNPDSPTLVGGIELDYAANEPTYLPSFPRNELPSFVVSNAIPKNIQADNYQSGKPPPAVRFKEPFLISTFQLKTERDSKFPSKGWLRNSPVNLYSSEGLDQKESWADHQFELQWEVMTDWPPSSPTIEISNTNNRGYGGAGIYAQSGVEFATHSSLPIGPDLSLAQLRHAPLNVGGQLPLTSQIVSNSFAPDLFPISSIRGTAGNRTYLDHSFYANSALFDKYFFSGLADPGGPLDQKITVSNSLTDLFNTGKPLPNNPRFIPQSRGRVVADIVSDLTGPEGYLKAAGHLLVDCPFNVNSTRVDVWEALLGSTFGTDVPQFDKGNLISAKDSNIGVTRTLPSNGTSFEAAAGQLGQDLAKWNGHRRLTPEQVRKLAEEVVKEVKSRGPFQSLSEFVNRRVETGELGKKGALQAAIDRSGINASVTDAAFNVSTATITGNTADGAPGILNQADLLTPLAPVLTARGDTFRIRAYGEASPKNGTKVRALCEAVVQRVPDYLDSADAPWVAPTKPMNIRFGRRYEVVSFRWLSPTEM